MVTSARAQTAKPPASVAAKPVASAAAKPVASAATEPVSSTECGTENLVAGKLPAQRRDLQGDAALATDGSVSREGSAWDAATTVILTGRGFIVYDLGRPLSISALFLQGDSNDTYVVTGSLDDSSGSYERLTEFANVVDRGHGLRNRSVQIAPKSARYLRVSSGKGDGSFSISEFSAYCRTPSPFPPALNSVGAPPPPPRERAPAAPPKAQFWEKNRTVLVLAAVVLAAFLLAPIVGRRSASRKTAGKGAKSKKGKTPPPAELTTHDHLTLLFLASGCAALIYEVVWLHLLAAGDRRFGAVGRHRARELHGRHVPRQPAVRALRRRPSEIPLRVYA